MVRVYNPFYGVYKNIYNGTIRHERAYDVISNLQKHEQTSATTDAFIKEEKQNKKASDSFEKEFKPIIKANETQKVVGTGYKKGDLFRASKKVRGSKYL